MESQLPNYEKWRAVNVPSFNIHTYLYSVLRDHSHAGELMYAVFQILWPQFVEVEGCVFLKEKYLEENYRRLREKFSSAADIEYWINLVSLEELLPSASQEIARALTVELIDSWRCKLKRDFPKKDFAVRIVEDDGTSYIVFTQEK